jgi:hypothetical protein
MGAAAALACATMWAGNFTEAKLDGVGELAFKVAAMAVDSMIVSKSNINSHNVAKWRKNVKIFF